MARLPSTRSWSSTWAKGILLTSLCASGLAQAQDAPAAEPAVEATAAPVEAEPQPAPAVTAEPVSEPAPVAVPPVEAVPEPIAEEPPAAEPEALPPISVNMWLHTGTMLRSYKDPEKLDRLSQDGEVDILFNGQLTKGFGMTANFAAVFGPTAVQDATGTTIGGNIAGALHIMDAHAKITFDDAFNIWVGRMLVPSDRSNFSGYWFAAPWTYPGKYDYFGPPVGPRQGPFGRNDGVTLWGQVEGGLFKYYVSAFDLYDGSGTALLSGRLNLSLINPEPGYYHSSTYYGGKDLLAIGIGAQYEKDGSGTDDYSEFNADILFEKNFGSGGVLDLEGAFYKYMGDGEAIDYSYMLVASWLTPEPIGWGKIQPLIRLQQAKRTDTAPSPEETDTLLDFQVGYVVDDYATRFALVYQRSTVEEVDGHNLTLGIQVQK